MFMKLVLRVRESLCVIWILMILLVSFILGIGFSRVMLG
jgi:multisubunit Na+/H+ antiporter MnhF subunit